MAPTIEKRNFFSAVVEHPGDAVTLAALLRLGGWGLNAAGTAKSGDSFTGDNAQIIPTSDAYVGGDDSVDATTGVLASGAQPFNVTAWCRGVVAADDIWIFSTGAQDIQIVFQSV